MSDVTIPEDVWEAAEAAAINAIAFSANPLDVVMPCVMAILAERERCAKIADQLELEYQRVAERTPMQKRGYRLHRASACHHVASSIRSSHE